MVEERAFSVCKDLTFCAVSLNEIARLVIEYPNVFAKDLHAMYAMRSLLGHLQILARRGSTALRSTA